MKPLKFSIYTLGKNLREVFVVVIGVAITLLASHWLGLRNEKRDMALYLNAVKLEIEENIKTLEQAIEEIQPSLRYSDYLTSNKKESYHKDTLDHYRFAYYSFKSYSLKTNAFEMFRNSGIMRLMNDKRLLLSLWDVYDGYVGVKEMFDWMFPIKWEDIKREVSLALEGQEVTVPMYNFYMMMLPYDMLLPCEQALRMSKEALTKLEQEKMIKRFKSIDDKSNSDEITIEDLDQYLGVYSSEELPTQIAITKLNNKLVAQPTGQSSFPLKAKGNDIFEAMYGSVVLQFNPIDKTVLLKQFGKEYLFKLTDTLLVQ